MKTIRDIGADLDRDFWRRTNRKLQRRRSPVWRFIAVAAFGLGAAYLAADTVLGVIAATQSQSVRVVSAAERRAP